MNRFSDSGFMSPDSSSACFGSYMRFGKLSGSGLARLNL